MEQLEDKLNEQKRQDFVDFHHRIRNSSLGVYNAYLTEAVNTGRYESKKDFIAQSKLYEEIKKDF